MRYWLVKSDSDTPKNRRGTPWSITKSLIKNGVWSCSSSAPPVPIGSYERYRDMAIAEDSRNNRGTRALRGTWAMRNLVRPGDRFIMIEYSKVVAIGTVAEAPRYRWEEQGTHNGYKFRLHSINVTWVPFPGNVHGVSSPGSELNPKGYQSTPFIEVTDNTALLKAVGLDGRHPKVVGSPEIRGVLRKPSSKLAIEFDPDWREGGTQIRLHISIERSAEAVKTVKDNARRKGPIRCECCLKVPHEVYGHEIIDAHHIEPLNRRKKSRAPQPKDFILLCPTCHRAVHKELSAGASGEDAILIIKNRLK